MDMCNLEASQSNGKRSTKCILFRSPRAVKRVGRASSLDLELLISAVRNRRSSIRDSIGSGGRNDIIATTPTPIDTTAVECGFATASQIGISILGTTYPNSFIVRTYSGGDPENPCAQAPR